jgi:FixJ family two-component response regulator
MSSPPMVHVVDDDPAVRDSLCMLLEQHGMAAAPHDGAAAFLEAAQAGAHGCAIIDMHMPGMDGLQLQKEMARRGLLLPVVFLTGHGSIPMSVQAIKAGAVNFLTKPVSAGDLMDSVRTALQESEQARAHAQAGLTATSRLAALTGREREVMALALQGMPNKEIARALGISHRTVEIHKARINHKTGVDNLLDLARVAEAGGWHP